MKRSIVLMCLVCALAIAITSCGKGTAPTSSGSDEENRFMSLFENRALRHGDVVYFVDEAAASIPIFYAFDLNSQTVLPLCSKPECEHNDRDCGAYVGYSDYPQIAVYNEKLYFALSAGSRTALYSQDLDGGGRVSVMQLPKEYEMYFQGMCFLGLYNGVVYRCGYGAKVEDAQGKNEMVLYSIPLGGEEPVEILKLSGIGWSVERMCGSKLYCAVFTNKDTVQLDLYCLDMDSAELTMLYSGEAPSMCNNISVVGDELLFSYSSQCFSYSLKTGEINTIGDRYKKLAQLSEDYLCVTESNTDCSVYDHNGNHLFTGRRLPEELDAPPYVMTFLGASDNVFYFSAVRDEDEDAGIEAECYFTSFDAKTFEAKLLKRVSLSRTRVEFIDHLAP